MKVKHDFLVIGSGIAGLTFALKAARYGKVYYGYQGKSLMIPTPTMPREELQLYSVNPIILKNILRIPDCRRGYL